MTSKKSVFVVPCCLQHCETKDTLFLRMLENAQCVFFLVPRDGTINKSSLSDKRNTVLGVVSFEVAFHLVECQSLFFGRCLFAASIYFVIAKKSDKFQKFLLQNSAITLKEKRNQLSILEEEERQRHNIERKKEAERRTL